MTVFDTLIKQYDLEIELALNAVAPGWMLLDIPVRCKMVSYAGGSETLAIDGKPVLDFGPIKLRTEYAGDCVKVTATREIRRLYAHP